MAGHERLIHVKIASKSASVIVSNPNGKSRLKSQFGANRGAVITLILAKKLNVIAFIEHDNISVSCALGLHSGISFHDKTATAQVSGKSLNQWTTEVLQTVVL